MTGQRVVLLADDEVFHVDCQPTDVRPGERSPYRKARLPRTDDSRLPLAARLAVRRLTCDACGLNLCDDFDAEEEDAIARTQGRGITVIR